MSTSTSDVLVVGAGPAGSAVAAALASSGRSVVLLDAVHHPRPKACAEYASPRIAEELARLGVPGGAWRADALPIGGMRVILGDDSVDIRYADARGRRPAWGLDRTRFDATLAEFAVSRGAVLRERTTFDDVRRTTGGWAVTVRGRGGREELRARWLIGADGSRSRVAHRLGVERTVRMPRRLGLVAHYEAVPELDDHGEMHVGDRHWYVGLAPLAGDRLNVGMALPARRRAATAEEPIRGSHRRHPGRRRAAGREPQRLTPIRGASPDRPSRGSVPPDRGWMLVGDAAGFIDPFTGEGIFRALRSARAAARHWPPATRAPQPTLPAPAGAEAFAAKDALTWTVQGMLAAQPVMRYALAPAGPTVRRSRTGWGRRWATCRPATDALSPAFLRRPCCAPMRSVMRVHVRAPYERIFGLAAEIERWPRSCRTTATFAACPTTRESVTSRWARAAARSRSAGPRSSDRAPPIAGSSSPTPAASRAACRSPGASSPKATAGTSASSTTWSSAGR